MANAKGRTQQSLNQRPDFAQAKGECKRLHDEHLARTPTRLQSHSSTARVNRTPTQTACTDAHSVSQHILNRMITLHHANGVAQGKPPIPIVQAPHFNRNLVKFLDLLTGIIEKHVDTRCGRPTRDFIQHSAIRKCFSRWRRHRRTAQPKPRASRTWGDDDDDRMADFEDVHAPAGVSVVNGINQTQNSTNKERPCTTTRRSKKVFWTCQPLLLWIFVKCRTSQQKMPPISCQLGQLGQDYDGTWSVSVCFILDQWKRVSRRMLSRQFVLNTSKNFTCDNRTPMLPNYPCQSLPMAHKPTQMGLNTLIWVSTCPKNGSQHARNGSEHTPNRVWTPPEWCQLVSRVNKSTPPPPLLLTTTAVVATWSGAKAPNTTRLKDAQRPPSFRIEKNARLLPSLQVAADSKAHIPDSSPTAITN